MLKALDKVDAMLTLSSAL